uniref:Uncharacterized protein n=1 Tax=Rhizophora mucronata TaxID=61149 RepID=A0A2P2M1J8_RHIMU
MGIGPSSPVTQLWFATASSVILCFGSLRRSPLIKSFSCTFISSGSTKGLLTILSYVSCNVSPRNGYFPSIIQYKVTPSAHVSAALP